MDIALVLSHLFPEADPTGEYIVSGGELVEWNLDAPQPTAEEIEAAWIPTLKELRKRELTAEAVEGLDGIFVEGFEERHFLGLLAVAQVYGDVDSSIKTAADQMIRLFAKRGEVDAISDDDAEAETLIRAVVL